MTRDAAFAGLGRQPRERGAMVHVIGEADTSEALRNASDPFFRRAPSEPAAVTQAAPRLA